MTNTVTRRGMFGLAAGAAAVPLITKPDLAKASDVVYDRALAEVVDPVADPKIISPYQLAMPVGPFPVFNIGKNYKGLPVACFLNSKRVEPDPPIDPTWPLMQFEVLKIQITPADLEEHRHPLEYYLNQLDCIEDVKPGMSEILDLTEDAAHNDVYHYLSKHHIAKTTRRGRGNVLLYSHAPPRFNWSLEMRMFPLKTVAPNYLRNYRQGGIILYSGNDVYDQPIVGFRGLLPAGQILWVPHPKFKQYMFKYRTVRTT